MMNMTTQYNMMNSMYSSSCEKFPEFMNMIKKAMEDNNSNGSSPSNIITSINNGSDTENSMSPVNNNDNNKPVENVLFRPQALIPTGGVQMFPLTDIPMNQKNNEVLYRNNIIYQQNGDNKINKNNSYKQQETVNEENNENKNHEKLYPNDDVHSETGSHTSCTTIDESSKSNSVSPTMKNHSDNDTESAYSTSPLPKEDYHDSSLPPISDAPTGVIVHGAKFNSYAEFDSVFEVWKNTYFHPFRVASSETLRQTDGTKNEIFQYRYIVFHCAHYGQPRMRGVGKRPNQSYLPCGCKAMLRLNYSYNDNALRITSLTDTHSGHPVDQENYNKVSVKGRRSTGESLAANKNRKRRSTSVMKKETASPVPQVSNSNNNNTINPTVTTSSPNIWKNMINGNQGTPKENLLQNPFVPMPNPTSLLNAGMNNNRNQFNNNTDLQNTLQNLAMFQLANNQTNPAAAAAQFSLYNNALQQQQQQLFMNNAFANLLNQQRNNTYQLNGGLTPKLDKENTPLLQSIPPFLHPAQHLLPGIGGQSIFQSQQPHMMSQYNNNNTNELAQLETVKEEIILGTPTPGQPPAKKDFNENSIKIKNIISSLNEALNNSSKDSLNSKITQLSTLLKIWNDNTGEMSNMKRLLDNCVKQQQGDN
uniref:FAR1 domain-containing protein n=1 Tax=Parastrongyloides trichosuri TaxID=131310 RepID=A0A0N4ZY65_PARTI